MKSVSGNGSHSFVFTGNVSANHCYLQSNNFDPTNISGSNKKSIFLLFTNYIPIGATMDIAGVWTAVAGERSWAIGINTSGQIIYLQSSDGTTTDIQVTTVSALNSSWNGVLITIDPTLSGASNVIKIYFDGILQTLTVNTDTGVYTTLNPPKTTKLRLGCIFGSSRTPINYYEGYINRFFITSDIISQSEITSFVNSEVYNKMELSTFDNLQVVANFDNMLFDGKYIVEESINRNDFIQINENSLSCREGRWCWYLNTQGRDGWNINADFSNLNDFFVDDFSLGTKITNDSTNGLVYTINHTPTTDQNPTNSEVISKCAYDLNQGDVWVGCTYNWDDNSGGLPHSHGGFCVTDCRTDSPSIFWTHRSLVNSNNTYRTLIQDQGVTTNYESTVTKGQQVWIRISKNGSNANVEWYWTNNHVLTQISSTLSLVGVRHIRTEFHAKDSVTYANPNTYSFKNMIVQRTQPIV